MMAVFQHLWTTVFVVLLYCISTCTIAFRLPLAINIRRRTALQSNANAVETTSRGEETVLVEEDGMVLRKVDSWACVKNCGACCKLGPLDSRPDLQSYLTTDQYELYVSMVGTDDWCKHFDKESRLCGIYETRPEFCRVDKNNFKKMFKIEEDEFSDFSTFCCRENIADVYGEESTEMDRFEDTIEQLQIESEDVEESEDEMELSKS